MQENNLPINIGTVAKLAGVSRTWIYNNPDLKKKIDRCRHKDDKIQRIVDLQQSVETRDRKIAHLKHRNQQQKAIIKKLRRQLEIVYGKLYTLNTS
jgi:predicted RNase H-like nuclease (RuvC/YqgF family)